jgi:predicted RNase H-like nuclease (RuvC/YqgF family)
VSKFEDDGGPEGVDATLVSLEGPVSRALARIRALEARVQAAEHRRGEVEGLLTRMADGDENPADMQARMKTLEAENEDLRRRLDEGREGVERMLAKVRFLEEQR